jgi:gliding motility-associated-like protein
MKHLLAIFLLVSAMTVTGQVTITIKPADTTVCFNDSVAFTTEISGTVTSTIQYRWQKNFIDIPGATDSLYVIAQVKESSPGIYRCIIRIGEKEDTSNVAILEMHPKINIDTLYRYNPLGCPGDCKGQFKVLVTGGTPFSVYPPYIYDWNGGHSQDTIVFGLCKGKYILTVTDSLQCSLDTSYYVDVLKLPKVGFEILPRDTVYLTNPNIQVVYPDSMKQKITNWTWDFGDDITIGNVNPASHTYAKTGKFPVRLLFTDINGCDSTVTVDLTVKVAELTIPNIFTPNGDGYNDRFAIQIKGESKKEDFRQAYLSNEFLVFDRWGKKVFSQLNYGSEDWDGSNLSDGTYYYILKCYGQYGDDVFRGSVTILRGK